MAISRLLRVGTLLAAVLILSGGIIYLVKKGSMPIDYATYREPQPMRGVHGFVHTIKHSEGGGWLAAGLMVLIMTPLLRVLLSTVLFIRRRDWTYAVLTFLVAILLLAGLCFGGAEADARRKPPSLDRLKGITLTVCPL